MWLLGVSSERKAASRPVRRSTPDRTVTGRARTAAGGPTRPLRRQNGAHALALPRRSACSARGSRSTRSGRRRAGSCSASSFFAAWLTGELAIWTHRLAGRRHRVLHRARRARRLARLARARDHARVVGRARSSSARCRAARASSFDTALTDGIGLDPPDHLRKPKLAPGRVPVPAPRPARRADQEPRVRPARPAQPARRLPAARRGPGGAPAPVLLQIHGGAWVIGDKSQQGLPLMLHLAAEGWVCVAINYRLSPKATWPEHLVDCKRALAWVREHIAEYGGDPDLICVTGGSAGGHLAAMIALTANEPRVPARLRVGRHLGRRVRAVLRRLRLHRALRRQPRRATARRGSSPAG